MSARWGMFGRSFNDIGNAIQNKIISFNEEFEQTGKILNSWKNSDSIWKRLYPGKESIKSQLIDVDALYPDINDTTASKLLTKLQKEQILVNANKKSWQDYFANLSDGEKWQIEFVQNTDLQKASLDDVKKAYNSAREAAIAQNDALKQQTLGAKALSVGAKALSTTLNAVASIGFAMLISGGIKFIDNLIHADEKAEELKQQLIETGKVAKSELDSIKSDFNSTKSIVGEISGKYAELAQKVGSLGTANQNQGLLSNDEYAEFLDISNQLADLFPTLKNGYDDNGNAILDLNGNVQAITSSLYGLLDAEKAVASAEMQEKMSDIYSGFKTEQSDYSDKYNNILGQKNGLDTFYTKFTNSDNDVFSDQYAELFEQAGFKKEDYIGKQWNEFSNKQQEAIKIAYTNLVNNYNKELNTYSTNIKNRNKEFADNLITSLQGDLDYEQLGDKKSIVNSILSNFGYDTELSGFDDWTTAYTKVIQDNIIAAIRDIDDDTVSQALSDIYSGNLSKNDFDSKVKIVQEYDKNNNNIDFSSWFKPDAFDITTAANQASQRLIDAFGDNISQQDKNIIKSYVENLTPQELDIMEKLPLNQNSIRNGATTFVSDLDKSIQEELTKNESSLDLNINPTASLDNISNAFSKFEGIFDDIQNGTATATNSIEALNETFGELDGGTALQEFKDVLTTMPDDIDAQKEALNKLATTYLDNSDLMQNLTEDNADYVTSELEKIGVMNAEEVVQSRLASQTDWLNQAQQQQELIAGRLASNIHSEADAKNHAYLASIDLQNATLGDITALIAEANAAGIDTTALSNYALQLIRAGQIPVTTDGSIKNLADFADQISETNEMSLLYAKMNYYNSLGTTAGYAAAMALEKEIRRRSVATIRSGQNKNTTVQYGSPNSGSVNNASNNSKDTFSETFDWLERRLNKLTTQTERWAAIIENATDAKRLNTYYKKLQSGYSSLAKTYSTAANYYLKRAENVGLEKNYQNKVKNGTINLEEINDKKLADKISTYQDYWDKYQEYLDSYIETQEKLANIPLDKAASKIELLSDAFDLLDAQLDNISVKNYKNANTNLDKQTQNVKKQLDANKEAQTAAKANYRNAKSAVQKKANLGADDLAGNKNKQAASKKSIRNAVVKGNEINLALYKEGSSGYKAAVKYNAALKAQKEAVNAVALSQEEYTKTLRENEKAKFDNISNYYSSRIGLRNNEISAIDNKISELEAAGKNVNRSYYKDQKKINNRKLNFYKDEKSALEESLKSIPKYTDEWYDAKDAIQECEDNISGCVEETYKLNNAINELHFDMYDDMADRIDRIISEQEFLQSLFAHENMTDSKTGGFTDAGLAKLGSLSASYYASKEKNNNDAELLRDLQNVRDKGKQSDGTYKLGAFTFNSLDDLQAKIDETYTTWQNDIKDTYNYESDIADLMKEKYQVELDMLQELIDAKKEALNAEKDLHDYKIQISEKTKDISTIRKQIAAYSGDSSEEGLSKLQKLQVELSKKEEDLSETEYERYISDQEDMLDKLYDEYEELVTKRLDDFMGLVHEGFNTVNTKMTTIDSYLSKIASENGYIEEFKKLFEENDIGKSVAKTTEDIEKDTRKNSGTEDTPPPPLTADTPLPKPKEDKKEPPKPKETPSLVGIKDTLTLDKASSRKFVKNYIKKNARKASKKRSEYGAVNQAIYDNKAKAYDGKGKILSSSALKGLAKELDIKYDNAGKKGTLYKKLKSIKFPGFSKGGIISVDDVRNQVINNGDTGLVSVHNGEGILTPLQTTLFGELTEKLPELNQALNLMGNMVDLPSLPTLSDIPTVKSNTTIGDMVFNIDLPNVTNPEEFVKAIQNEPKVQKALRAVTTDRLTGNGRLSVRNII